MSFSPFSTESPPYHDVAFRSWEKSHCTTSEYAYLVHDASLLEMACIPGATAVMTKMNIDDTMSSSTNVKPLRDEKRILETLGMDW